MNLTAVRMFLCALSLLALSAGLGQVAAQCGCGCAGMPDLRVSNVTCEQIAGGVFRVVAEVTNCGTVDVTQKTTVQFAVFENPPFNGIVKRKQIAGIAAGGSVVVMSGAMATGSFGFCTAEVDVDQEVAECTEGLGNQAFPECNLLAPQSCCYCTDGVFPFPAVYDCALSLPAGCVAQCP